MRSPDLSRFASQLKLAFLLGMAAAVLIVSAIGSTEKQKLRSEFGEGFKRSRLAHPITH